MNSLRRSEKEDAMIQVPKDIGLGKHFTYGEYDPAIYRGNFMHLMFSIGVHRVELRKSGKGTKASKCIVRVKGYTSQADAVREKAEEIREKLDAGTYCGKSKFVRVPWVPGLSDAGKGKHEQICRG
jgi:hypothetical protein